MTNQTQNPNEKNETNTLSSYERAKLERERQQELVATRFKEEQGDGVQNDDDEDEEEEYDDQQEQLEEENDILAGEEEEQTARSQFQQIQELARQQAKTEIEKTVEKKAKKMFFKSVILPVLEAVGTFFVATWWFWLILLIMIFIVAAIYAYSCDIVSLAPAALNPLAQYFGFECST